MHKIDIAGLKVDCTTKEELLKTIEQRMRAGERTFITTPYSEFLYHALHGPELLKTLNLADISVPDGIGIFWAAKFLSIKFIFKNYWLKILEALWQIIYSLLSILIYPKYIYSALPGAQKISGSDLAWDLAKLAAENNWTIYLLGGFGDTPKLAADKLEKYCHTLIPRGRERSKYKLVAGYSHKDPDDPAVNEDIKKANPDMVFVAYGPLRQEHWIAANMQNLPGKLYIGLGGTFDYIAGKQPQPPKFVRKAGLEWFYRLMTQPKRIKRIYHATFGLISALLRYKVFSSMPYRQNAVSVVMNSDNKIFIARYNPEKSSVKKLGRGSETYESFWQFPQGGIEKNEDIEEGARRELWEETAMRHVELLKISEYKNGYSWYRIASRPLLVSKRYQYKGQEQHIVYFRFTGEDKEINLDFDEFLEYKWVSIEDLEKEIHDNKQPLVKIALQDLPSILQNL